MDSDYLALVSYLGNQFTDQSVPLPIRLQAAVFVIWGHIDFILEAQIVGQSIQHVDGVALVFLWFSQDVLGHHHKWLLLEGKEWCVRRTVQLPINTCVIQAFNQPQLAILAPGMVRIMSWGADSVTAVSRHRRQQ